MKIKNTKESDLQPINEGTKDKSINDESRKLC
jgi:hypothetical protein